ncbi:Replication factor C subunit 1 [Taphrina deformans PYCC 5710]|uniref:Replication factor C subunit 1 n=1 Tax=Taphrina deformans (strain PYCC 5710 / ATCC 11124 / CBS 356.35 / IMI 108563 / JCM 9778 / NBRC 8474) TaxID=1097556 RepID=R4XI90_TAPDE|nr:Replication factor C subunit 1 [Taphrina deformans PYCC 5710]|eukprot:CCG83102.1 Replication factor C subunit 1 [Taphrina deformans PYCC 5710]
MSDIRNFFNAKAGSQVQPRTKEKRQPVKKRIITDSDDDDEFVPVQEPTTKKPTTNKSKKSETNVKDEDPVDPEDFFGDEKINKLPPKRSTRAKVVKKEEAEEYGEMDLDDADLEMLDSQEAPISKKRSSTASPRKTAVKSEDSDAPNERKRKALPDSGKTDEKPLTSQLKSPSKKKVKLEVDDLDKTAPPEPQTKSTPKKAPAKVKAATVSAGGTTNGLLDSIPAVPLPEPGEPVKFQFGQAIPGASAPGSKEIPEGAEGCLSGLTFVFTGILQSLERTEAQDLVKRYGGKVTTAPSKNTSFVVLGEQAGPKKIEKIGQLGVKVIDEDGLLKMIAIMPAQGGDSAAAQKAVEKRVAEEKKALDMAKEFEKTEAKQKKENAAKTKEAQASGAQIKVISATDQLWTTKYAPSTMKDVIGNKANVERLARFLDDWPKNLKANFKKAGPEGLGLYRAVLLSGSPGIGKTTSAHLVAKLAGYDILEFNASDTRSKKLLEEGLKGVVNNTSLNGYFGAEGHEVDVGKKRLVLIMDEVDGMSAGDRGGVGALNAVIKKTTIPIICICNDRSSQKLKPLDRTTFDLKFSKPTKEQVRSRIMSIAFREGLKINPQAIDQLVDGTGSDIRQIINLLSTYRLTTASMDQDQGKAGAKSAEKHVILKPWDIVGKLLNGAIYHERSKVTLNEKIELYFNDHDLSYLMVQENYLNTTPDRARAAGGPREQALKRLQLVSKAAGAISDGDLVDSMIRGQQQWSLMPVHGVFSCVRPGSFVAGAGGRYSFTSVLGNLSRLNKANRLLREVRAHLRLKISGDRQEIRRDYLPALFDRLPRTLAEVGPDAIPRIIGTMDDYLLTRDDWDALLELGLGGNDRAEVEARISSATKAAFTRAYNKVSHPTAFLPAQAGPPPKKLKAGEVPDFEDAVDLSGDEEAVEEKEGRGDNADQQEEEEDALDLKNDKFIQAPKNKKQAATAAKKKTKKK